MRESKDLDSNHYIRFRGEVPGHAPPEDCCGLFLEGVAVFCQAPLGNDIPTCATICRHRNQFRKQAGHDS